MGRPSIRAKLTITPKDDSRFLEPRTLNSIPDASFETGLTDREIRAAYHSKRESLRKRSGEVYNLEWEEPDAIRVKPPGNSKECVKCSKTLTLVEKSWLFRLDRGNDDESLQFVSLSRAWKVTGISICAPRNACEKTNPTITRRKRGIQKFEVDWSIVCNSCCPKSKKEILLEIGQLIFRLKV